MTKSKNMKMTKNPSLGAALLMVLIVTGIFTFGLFSAVQSEGNRSVCEGDGDGWVKWEKR